MTYCNKHKIDHTYVSCPYCQGEGSADKAFDKVIDDDFKRETFGPLIDGGTRNNDCKAQLSMILEAKHALNGCAAVLEMGAKKYLRGNWRKGLNHNEVVDSLLRHLTEYMSGQESDEESGLLHVDHILCNALFLAELTRTHPKELICKKEEK